jgi:hypothetical protein
MYSALLFNELIRLWAECYVYLIVRLFALET